MEPHGSKENGLNWDDGFIHYSQIQTVVTEALASYDHLYARGSTQFDLLGDILNRPIHNYEDLGCPAPKELKSNVHCYLTCHAFPDMQCAARNAYGQHCWLQYHFSKKPILNVPLTTGATLCSSPQA